MITRRIAGVGALGALASLGAYAAAPGPKSPRRPDAAQDPKPMAGVRTDTHDFDAAVRQRFGGTAPYYEVRLPTKFADRMQPKGVVLVVHGGSWTKTGRRYVSDLQSVAGRWQNRGWVTVNVDYRRGAHSVEDVRAFYDSIRDWQGADVPIGIEGASAGGHLALMTAIERPDTAFVIGTGAVTDPAHIHSDGGSEYVQRRATQYFGDQTGTTFSPVHRADELKTEVLLAASDGDRLIPPTQIDQLRRVLPHAQVLHLERGHRTFTHAGISDAAFAQFVLAEYRMGERHALNSRGPKRGNHVD